MTRKILRRSITRLGVAACPSRERSLSELGLTMQRNSDGTQIELVSVSTPSARAISFQLVGRSPATRRFRQECEAYEKASADSVVALEWIYLPFYYLYGHSVVRIGKEIFDFGKNGWRIHSSPSRFLFSNPFFSRRFERYRSLGMPPFSFGVELRLSKAKCEVFRESVRDEFLNRDRPGAFSVLQNNCNQRLLLHLRRAKIDVPLKGYQAFSSLATFHHFLYDSSHASGIPRLYPLPGRSWMNGKYHRRIPRYIFDRDTLSQRIKRCLWWP